METQNGKVMPHKKMENGVKGKPPYSVETPYGFQLDLDFLKYVDDIEKGNTIKKIPIQRRSKGSRSSTLPRNLNPSVVGNRQTPWGSTGALGPRSRLSDIHHHGYTSRANDHRLLLSPTGLEALNEMEARIKEFDEQPLGEHIRPHLLRASSLPLTVLLRQGSESTDDPGSLRSSRDHLAGRISSCEDVFDPQEGPQSRDYSEMLRRLREAMERVEELEMETRMIPELRAQISILQEEKKRLGLSLNTQIPHSSRNGTADSHSSSHYGAVDVKRPRHEGHIMFPRKTGLSREDSNPSHEWRTSTDLDELLTVTSLQAKVAVLEQKLHESGLELQRALGLLREQQEESRKKDGKIEHLVRSPGVWVCSERVMIDQDGEQAVARSIGPYGKVSHPETRTSTTNGEKSRQQDSVDTSDGGVDTELVVHHIKKIKRLLDKQWECFCEGLQSGEEGGPREHPDPNVNSLQQEMVRLVDILTSYYSQHGAGDGELIQHGASKSREAADGSTRTSKSRHAGDVNESGEIVGQNSVNESEQKERSIDPGELAADPDTRRMEGARRTSPDRQMISGGTGSARTDGGPVTVEAEALEKTAKMKPQPSGEQMEGSSGSESTAAGRETVISDFMAACQFLKDHMDNMENPNDDMRKALVVLFKHWFSVAAEEASVASELAVYLREVRKTTPSLLAFLVNMADGNGNTVLHYSVSHCNYSIVSLLLDTGVSDLNLQNNAGYTTVMLASLTVPDGPGGMEVVRKLMELGDIHIRSNQTGQTALHLAVRHGRVVMVRLLLSHGADTNIQDSQGTTALMFASERGHTHIARLLLERIQCDLTLMDKRGRTALSIAMQGSHTDTAALLQAHAKSRAL